MYGVDRSVVRLSIDGVVEGGVEGSTMLEVKGRVGVHVMFLKSVVFEALVGRSQDVFCVLVLLLEYDEIGKIHALFVSSCHFDLKIVVVILLTRSAVPIWPPLEPSRPNPQPLLGLFSAPIVFAAALMTALRSAKSCTAGVATAAGARMMPVTYIAVKTV